MSQLPPSYISPFAGNLQTPFPTKPATVDYPFQLQNDFTSFLISQEFAVLSSFYTPAVADSRPPLSILYDGTNGANIFSTSMSYVTLFAQGTGYSGATATCPAPPAGGTQATFTVTQIGSSILLIAVNNPGSGYLTGQPVTISGGGTGAIAYANLGGATCIGDIGVTNEGNGITKFTRRWANYNSRSVPGSYAFAYPGLMQTSGYAQLALNNGVTPNNQNGNANNVGNGNSAFASVQPCDGTFVCANVLTYGKIRWRFIVTGGIQPFASGQTVNLLYYTSGFNFIQAQICEAGIVPPGYYTGIGAGGNGPTSWNGLPFIDVESPTQGIIVQNVFTVSGFSAEVQPRTLAADALIQYDYIIAPSLSSYPVTIYQKFKVTDGTSTNQLPNVTPYSVPSYATYSANVGTTVEQNSLVAENSKLTLIGGYLYQRETIYVPYL